MANVSFIVESSVVTVFERMYGYEEYMCSGPGDECGVALHVGPEIACAGCRHSHKRKYDRHWNSLEYIERPVCRYCLHADVFKCLLWGHKLIDLNNTCSDYKSVRRA